MSNVELHANSRSVITEDIKGFFDHITADRVFEIWRDFFGFDDESSALLTALTTREGRVFQGTPTSSYLANLAFWDVESILVQKLASRGLRYSRYVDDVTISSGSLIANEEKAWAIGQVIAMMGSRGFKVAREKHGVQSPKGRISVMGLNVSRSPGLSSTERSSIRAAVHQLEQRFRLGEAGPALHSDISKASGRVGRMRRFHKEEAERLRARLRVMTSVLDAMPVITSGVAASPPLSAEDGSSPF